MKFKSSVLSLILLAGVVTVAPYGIFGGSIRPAIGFDQETLAGLGSRSFSGSAAGGQAGINRAPDCRSCTRKGQHPEPRFPGRLSSL